MFVSKNQHGYVPAPDSLESTILKLTGKISLNHLSLLFQKIVNFWLFIWEIKSSRWKEENNRLLFSITGIDNQGLNYCRCKSRKISRSYLFESWRRRCKHILHSQVSMSDSESLVPECCTVCIYWRITVEVAIRTSRCRDLRSEKKFFNVIYIYIYSGVPKKSLKNH